MRRNSGKWEVQQFSKREGVAKKGESDVKNSVKTGG